MPELRHDPITDRLVIVAPERAARPHTAAVALPPADRYADDCPFCPGNEAETPPELARVGGGEPNCPGWQIRIFPNKYPIVETHEVIAFSPDHDRSFAHLEPEDAAQILGLLRDRAAIHLADGHEFVQVSINHGAAAGASIAHPHAQLLAIDLVPPTVEDAIARLDDAGLDLLARELAEAGQLTVVPGAATAWCPPAASAPFQVRVAHRSTRARFDEATDAEIGVVSEATLEALRRLESVLGDIPYNLVVHTAPPGRGGHAHWYVEITPRIATVAGFEMGTGILVNPIAPEHAAAVLRDVP